MPTAATTSSTASPVAASRSPAIERWLKPNSLLLLGIWLFTAVHFYNVWPSLGVAFRDTDDIMRLVEVRDFLAGQGWYDLHQYRLDPPADIPMHWSRFVDLPIALLIRLFGLFLAPETAVKAAMFVWPALPLLPVLWASRALAVGIGGEWAAFPALYLLATHGLVLSQFVPGRIDHHNVQIALTLLLLSAMVGPTGVRRGVLAGIIGAMMMAVGMETLPFLMLVAAGLGLRWVFEGDDVGEAKAFGLALAVATLTAAGVTLPVSEWGRGACDALSLNYIGLGVVGGLGLAAVAGLAPKDRAWRAVALVGVAAAAVAAFGWAEPACLKGPFGQILPEVRSVWLDGVNEVKPWTAIFREAHLEAIASLLMPVLAMVAFGLLARVGDNRRNIGFWLLGVSMVLATAIGLMQIRTMVYANVLALPLVAAGIGLAGRDSEARGRSITVTILGGSVLINLMVLQMALEQIAPASWRAESAAGNAAQGVESPVSAALGSAENKAAAVAAAEDAGMPCYTTTNYAELAALPPGLVAADIDMGPSILLATKHSVLAAPYHRMQRGILDSHHILNRSLPEAFAVMAARGVDYLAVCTASKVRVSAGGIVDRLRAGSIPAGLEEIPGKGVVRVFRVHALPVLTSR